MLTKEEDKLNVINDSILKSSRMEDNVVGRAEVAKVYDAFTKNLPFS